jgi:enoyl-CoA hydratase
VSSSPTKPDAIEVADKDRVAVITINRPDKANALRRVDKEALAAAIQRLQHSDTAESIVITGSGPRSFCAGSDIGEMQAFGSQAMFEMLGAERSMYAAAMGSPKPVVAAVNGFALGAGLILAMCCDYVVASDAAELGTPELTIGVSVPLEGLLLPWIVGLGRAREMFYRARRLKADEALATGLVHEVVPRDACLPAAIDAARAMADLPGSGFRVHKAMLHLLLMTGSLEAAAVASQFATSGQFATSQTGEAMRAFLDRSR